ncbi:hypothetical protein [Bradyrhizobium neotropicale]|uniref:hypothetical protein n=1 Tax=Bradyrhizobium neotropicale TaxID=1497615 RepID=UPI001AD7CA29|nr:hypothetical protein [Bradyrhizobium neotropicale]MBO4228158.1 hypothetical protein [Bradyrhizobium neotropicale]
MSDDATPLQWVYLTLPEPDRPILNIQAANSDEFRRFALNRDQLLRLNAQTADALLKREIH